MAARSPRCYLAHAGLTAHERGPESRCDESYSRDGGSYRGAINFAVAEFVAILHFIYS